MVLGVCFGLGYGITHRLANLDVVVRWSGGQSFGLRPFPGTGLDAMRRSFGGEARAIRGDLELLELERQKKKDEELARKRSAAIEERERQQAGQSEEPADPGLPPVTEAREPEAVPLADPDAGPSPPPEDSPVSPPSPPPEATPTGRP